MSTTDDLINRTQKVVKDPLDKKIWDRANKLLEHCLNPAAPDKPPESVLDPCREILYAAMQLRTSNKALRKAKAKHVL